jgi:hypothetical protein
MDIAYAMAMTFAVVHVSDTAAVAFGTRLSGRAG